MDLSFLSFLTRPALIIPWYALGIAGAGWTVRDTVTANRNVQRPLKAAWPIIIVFFSVIGEALYVITCRPAAIGAEKGKANARAHHAYVAPRWKGVVGSTMHCVAGDGLGIITAMVFTRLVGTSFWIEFWTEYAVGFVFGWLIFQTWAMREAGNSWREALWMGGRAEFFSMMTLMLGMGLFTRFVVPGVVGARPLPTSAAFWGFGAAALLIGALFTYPMNWWLVSIGWKHGMS